MDEEKRHETLSSWKTSKICSNLQFLHKHPHLPFGSCVLCLDHSNTLHTWYQAHPNHHPCSVIPFPPSAIVEFWVCSLTCPKSSSHFQSKARVGIHSGKLKEAQASIRPPLKSLHFHTQFQLKEVKSQTLSLCTGNLRPRFVNKKCSLHYNEVIHTIILHWFYLCWEDLEFEISKNNRLEFRAPKILIDL